MDGDTHASAKPASLLICAMGGEGGGVLTGWIVAAARAQGLAVQATSVPGVAQRTGATNYYIEMAALSPDGRSPIFALVPVAGEVDVVLASELLEAARAARLGFVTPERTSLIASTHRVFLIQEKMAMGDGRIDPVALETVARSRARGATTFDMDAIARETGAPISAVMLGALSGVAALPIGRGHYELAIRDSRIAVDKNLAAFTAAHTMASGAAYRIVPRTVADFIAEPIPAPATGPAARDPLSGFPPAARATIAIGEKRLVAWQDERYAALYRQRLEPFAAFDPVLCREVARHLALRMSYEDVIRVAQAKAAPERFERIRGELGASAGNEPFEVQDFFKPGVNELADVLPPRLARFVLGLAARHRRVRDFHIGMKLKTTTVSGYLRVWLLAKLRRWRRGTWRYAQEHAAIEAWLGLVRRAADGGDAALAREIAELARLIKGYGDTHARGTANYRRIVETLVEPALSRHVVGAGAEVRRAREAALAEPEGTSLGNVLASAFVNGTDLAAATKTPV